MGSAGGTKTEDGSPESKRYRDLFNDSFVVDMEAVVGCVFSYFVLGYGVRGTGSSSRYMDRSLGGKCSWHRFGCCAGSVPVRPPDPFSRARPDSTHDASRPLGVLFAVPQNTQRSQFHFLCFFRLQRKTSSIPGAVL